MVLEVFNQILTPQGGWSLEFVLRVFFSTLLVFAFVILVARLFGPRTFASFTSFDFLINIVAGSLVASAILGQNLIGSALALATLAILQAATSGLSARLRGFHDMVDNPPVVLIENGQLLRGRMHRVRVSEQSLMQKLRAKGVTEILKVRLAVLESGGDISVIRGEGGDSFPSAPRRDGVKQGEAH